MRKRFQLLTHLIVFSLSLFSAPPTVFSSYNGSIPNNFGITPIGPFLGYDSDNDLMGFYILTIPSAQVGTLYAGGMPITVSGAFIPSTLSSDINFDPSSGFEGVYTMIYNAKDALGNISNNATYAFSLEGPSTAYYNIVHQAELVGFHCFNLTKELFNQKGGAWSKTKVNLNNSFELRFNIYLGNRDANGADGLAFVMQNQSLTPFGNTGEGLGYETIKPSIAVEFDTWQNGNEMSADHIAIDTMGNVGQAALGPVQASAISTNIEDGQSHFVRITWDKPSSTLQVYFDNSLRLTYTKDLINQFFKGNPNVFFGFTASTGGATNLHQVCDVRFYSFGDNLSPDISNQYYSVDEDNILTINPFEKIADRDNNLDTSSVTVKRGANPAKGAATLNTTIGFIKYTPLPNYFGKDTLILSICDKDINGAQQFCSGFQGTKFDTVFVLINSINDAPILTTVPARQLEDDISIGTITGFSDIENDILTIKTVTDTITAKGGRMTIYSNGSFSYVPAADTFGIERFIYRICDPSTCSSSMIIITLDGVQDPPKASNFTISGFEGSTVTSNILNYAYDPDKEPITVTSINATGTIHGQLKFSGNGIFTYIPDDYFFGIDMFQYSVCDPLNTCTSATMVVTITNVPDKPIVNNVTITGLEDTTISGSISSSYLVNDGGVINVTAVNNLELLHGKLSLSSSGDLTYIPNLNYFGSESFVYTVCGAAPSCSSARLTIVVQSVYDLPIANNLTISGMEDEIFTSSFASQYFTIENYTLSLVGINLQITQMANKVTIQENGNIKFIPQSNFNGIDTFNYTICDPISCVSGLITFKIKDIIDPIIASPITFSGLEDNAILSILGVKYFQY